MGFILFVKLSDSALSSDELTTHSKVSHFFVDDGIPFGFLEVVT